MDQAAPHPDSVWSTLLEHDEAGPPRLCASVPEARLALSVTGLTHEKLIEGLRRRIQSIERHPPVLGQGSCANPAGLWTTGAGELDAYLGVRGLDTAGVHEIKPSTPLASCAIASLSFALRLAGRRLQQLKAAQPSANTPRILWCVTRHSAGEMGELYGPGLSALGLDRDCLIIVETARASETLWAMEEGLKSASLALVVGQFSGTGVLIGLTPARRLSLAAEQTSTPCLLLTSQKSQSVAATSTRWRIDWRPSAPHPFDADAPGPPRMSATLERCQHRLDGDPLPFVLEWRHERYDKAHLIRVAAALADRKTGAPHAGRRTG